MAKSNSKELESRSTAELVTLSKAGSDESEQASDILRDRANMSDHEAFKAVKAASPAKKERAETVMSRLARMMVLEKIFPEKYLLIRWEVGEDLHRVQREVAGENPTALEWLLAERVAFCHAMLNAAEWSANSRDKPSVRQVEFDLARVTTIQNRLLQAARTLAYVRKLRLPNVQVNIGEKQINVA